MSLWNDEKPLNDGSHDDEVDIIMIIRSINQSGVCVCKLIWA